QVLDPGRALPFADVLQVTSLDLERVPCLGGIFAEEDAVPRAAALASGNDVDLHVCGVEMRDKPGQVPAVRINRLGPEAGLEHSGKQDGRTRSAGEDTLVQDGLTQKAVCNTGKRPALRVCRPDIRV